MAVTPYLAKFLSEEDAEAVTRAYLARAVEEAEREAAANAPIEVSSGPEYMFSRLLALPGSCHCISMHLLKLVVLLGQFT